MITVCILEPDSKSIVLEYRAEVAPRVGEIVVDTTTGGAKHTWLVESVAHHAAAGALRVVYAIGTRLKKGES